MSFPISLLVCLSVAQLSVGDELIKAQTATVLGGWNHMNPKSPEIQDAAQFGVKMFNSKSKTQKMYKLASVTSAQFQVTNRLNYKIDAVLSETECLKTENKSLDKCSFGKKEKQCHFKVTKDPGTNNHELEAHECRNAVAHV